MNWLIGGPIMATIVAAWDYIKGVLHKIRSLFILNVIVEGSLIDAVAFYCWHNFKRIKIGDRKYSGRRVFVRSSERYQDIVYELFGQSSIIFWKSWKFLSVGNIAKDDSNHSSKLNLTFIRGTWNIDKLMIDALALYNKHNYKGFQEKRFCVVRKYGSLGLSDTNHASPQPGIDDRIVLWDKRLVGISADDIGQKIHESGYPFESLALPNEVWDSIKDIERWKNSEEWYKKKNIPWKRGWLLHGPPGTGKTSVVRAISEYLDIPVISFVLSSFADQEFQEEWDSLRSFVPCVALIEDIDTVFNGRKNVTKGRQSQKPLSFDVLLNTIDGISLSDGVFTIITTNRLEYLDPALGGVEERGVSTRPGRIDKTIKLDILSEDCRKQIANRILVDYPDLIDQTIIKGMGDTGAQFQDRCSKAALARFWK